MASARRYFRFSLAVGAVGALTLLLALAAVAQAVALTLPTAGEFADACQRFMAVVTWPAILVISLASLGVACTVRGLRALCAHQRSQAALGRRLEVFDEVRALGVRAHVFADERPQAFCVGLLRPRIFVSSGTVAILDERELAAVLAHEVHHASRRDPLRVLVARVLADALFFLPIMRHAADRYTAMAEMAADEAAVLCCGDRGALASAMLTFDERAPAGTVGIAAERVDHLLGQPPRWQLSLSLLAAAVVTIAAVAMLGAATAAAAPDGGLSVAVLAAQLCAFAMTAGPILAGAALILTVRGGVGHLRRT